MIDSRATLTEVTAKLGSQVLSPAAQPEVLDTSATLVLGSVVFAS